MNYSYDNYGWLTSTHNPERCTDVVPPTETAAKKANWTGINWVLADYVAPPDPVVPVVVNPTEFLIDKGSFFDRFGAAKMPVLLSDDTRIKAILVDVASREWIDLSKPEVAQSVAYIASVIPELTAAMQSSILGDPVTPDENLVLRKLFF